MTLPFAPLVSLLAAAVLIWPWQGQPTGDAQAQFVSGPVTRDLVCPVAKSAPTPVTATPAPAPHLPAASQLGALRTFAFRPQPVLSQAAIPNFAFTGASPSHPLRVAIWGDSHTAAGPFAPTLADALRGRGVTTDAGYLPPTMGRANVRLPAMHAYCIGPAWSTELAFTAQGTLQTGPALANRVAQAGPDSYLWLDLRDASGNARIASLDIVYRSVTGGALEASVNDGPVRTLSLVPGDGSHTLAVRADKPIGTLRLRVSSGAIALHGFQLAYTGPNAPSAVFDTFSLPSSTAHGWANIDPAYLASALNGAAYDAVILEYGTNEGNDPGFTPAGYAADLTVALTNVRKVFPAASCVLVGPPDRGVLAQGRAAVDVLKYARIHQQIETIQRSVGAQFGCAPWNWQDVMGGPGGSYGWVLNSPSLMGGDLTHLTAEGYRRTAGALAHSLGWQP